MNIIEFFKAGGIVMYPLLLISLGAVAIMVERFIAYRTLADNAPDLTVEATRMVRAGRHAEALRLAESRQGPVAAAIATVVRHRGESPAHLEGRVAEVIGEYELRLERFLPFIDTATTLSPLLGLLGTIIGMVSVFQRFQGAGADEAAKQAILGGVGEALYATASGIFVAVVCFAAYNYFAARVKNTLQETEVAATRVMNAMNESGAAGTSAAPVGAVPATAMPVGR
jgi:Biopolymer transport proteins